MAMTGKTPNYRGAEFPVWKTGNKLVYMSDGGKCMKKHRRQVGGKDCQRGRGADVVNGVWLGKTTALTELVTIEGIQGNGRARLAVSGGVAPRTGQVQAP